MANERTFLAWIRTSIGIMAFGFVVEKFALFVRQASHFFSSQKHSAASLDSVQEGSGYSSIFGVLLIGLGAFMGVLAFIRYPSSMRKCNTWRNSLIAGTLGGYGKRIQAHQFRGEG
jgi:putative membrane protein